MINDLTSGACLAKVISKRTACVFKFPRVVFNNLHFMNNLSTQMYPLILMPIPCGNATQNQINVQLNISRYTYAYSAIRYSYKELHHHDHAASAV